MALDHDHYPKNGKDRSNKNPQSQVPNGSFRLPDVATIPTDPGGNNLEASLSRQLALLGSPGVLTLWHNGHFRVEIIMPPNYMNIFLRVN